MQLSISLASRIMRETVNLIKKTCIFSATAKTIAGMLLGRLLVGAGMGLGPPVVSLYVTEVCKLLLLVPL